MRNLSLIIMTLAMTLSVHCNGQSEIEWIRTQFHAEQSESSLNSIINFLPTKSSVIDQQIIHAYQAVCLSKMASYKGSPYEKYSCFTDGQEALEIIVSKNQGVEVRYLRLLVQLNAPGFLGYNDNIEEDVQFIVDRFYDDKISSDQKKNIVRTLLLMSDEHSELLPFKRSLETLLA